MSSTKLVTAGGEEAPIQTMNIHEKDSNSTTTAEAASIVDLPISKIDDAVLRAQGHEAAMPRSFSMMSALGLGFSITNSWVGYLSNFGQNLIYGGPQSVIFGLLVAAVAQWTITLGLSEIASAFPSSGGQYHFVFILAPQKTRRFAAFVVGWMTLLGWWVVTCSGVSLATISIFGMVSFWDSSFHATQWMVYCLFVGVALLTVAPLFLCPKWIPTISQTCLYVSVLGFFVNFIVILAMKKHTQPGSFIVESGLGTSGWGTGTAWVLGVTNAMYAFGGTDGAIHIAEEMSRPGKRLPQVMNLTMAIGFGTCFPLFVAMMFAVTDISAVTASALPSAEVLYQATGSKNVATFLMSWVIVVYVTCLSSQWVTCGRMAWAFARDNGIPFSTFFSVVNTRLEFPVNSTILSVTFVCVYGLLYLASTTAFNSIVTSAVLYLNITYAIPQAIVAIRGRANVLPNRPFNLGRLGYVCNVFAPLFCTVLAVLVCFPPGLPVKVGTMNYTSVVLVGLFLVIVAFWFGMGKKNFRGPNIDWEMLNTVNLIK